MALNNLVKKIFSNEATKAEFRCNPEAFISKFSLSETEKKAVLASYARTGLVTADGIQLQSSVGPMGAWV